MTPVLAAARSQGRVALAQLRPPRPGLEPVPGFSATWHGSPCRVQAVLERTAVVFEHPDGERQLANKRDLMVEAASIRWQEPGIARGGRFQRRAPRRSPDQVRAQRDASDRRAIASRDQARPAAVEAAPRSATVASPVVKEPGGRPQPGPAPSARTCTRCGRELARHNRGDARTACQRACPACGAAKSVRADRGRRCQVRRTSPRPAAGEVSTTRTRPELDDVPAPAVDELAARIPSPLEEGPQQELREDALRVAEQLERLPAPVRDLVGQVVGAFARIQELEAELERHLATERRIVRRVHRCLRSLDTDRAAGRRAGEEDPNA